MKHWTMIGEEMTNKVAALHQEAAIARALEPRSVRVRLAHSLRAVADWIHPARAPANEQPLIEKALSTLE
jgi:hypothetical protein